MFTHIHRSTSPRFACFSFLSTKSRGPQSFCSLHTFACSRVSWLGSDSAQPLEWPVTQYRALEAPPRLLGGCELSFVCDGFTWPLCGHDCGSPVHCRDRGCPRAHRISAVPKPGGRSRSRETRRIQVIRCAGFLCVESLFLQHCSEETLVAPLYQGSKTTPTLGR